MVSLMKIGQITDKQILTNKEQIQVIAQILKIIIDDVKYLDEHVKQQSMR